MQEANKPKEAAKIWPEDLARVYHNEVYKQDPDVWMIWGNGSVTLTKGGELFGQRSLHQIAREIPGTECFYWLSKFPIKSGEKDSYAIVESEDKAFEIRGLIIDRVCDWLKSRKELKY
jgi:hypothetical protein